MPAAPEGNAEARPQAPAAVPVRIAVVGAGAVGGYFGALLARAGHRVDATARGTHLDAIRQRGGIEVHESDGSSFVAPVVATDDPATLVGAPFTILAVKTYSLPEVGPTLRTLAEAGTTLVSMLNGVDITDRLSALGVPRKAVLPGLTYVATARTAPGVITRTGAMRSITVGEMDHHISERARLFVATLRAAGIESYASDSIDLELWRKFAFLATMAAICGLARRSVGPVRSAPCGRTVLERAVREVVAVARAHGIPFSDDDVRRGLGVLEGLPDGNRPSFLADLERGGPTELDALSGTVVRLARTMGIDTPIHEVALAALTAQASGSAR